MITLILIVWLHFIGDFILQSDSVAKGKSGSWRVLGAHVFLYSLPFCSLGLLLPINGVVLFVALNAAAHFLTDAVSSRIAKHYWMAEQRHNFFVTIGADQAVHATCLIASAYMIFG